MTFKFFRLVLSVLLLGGTAIQAQNPPAPGGAIPSPEKGEKKPKFGYLRLWNLLPADMGEIQLLQETGAGEANGILGAEPSNVYAGYTAFKPGRYALKIVRSADQKNPIKNFDLILRPDVFVTFFVRNGDGKISAELLDDTYDRAVAMTGKVTIRQMIPEATVTIKGPALSAPISLAYGEERIVENIPLKNVAFQMQSTARNNQVRSWAAEIDFASAKHASLWLINDVYGRFRPRAAVDGQTDEEPTAP